MVYFAMHFMYKEWLYPYIQVCIHICTYMYVYKFTFAYVYQPKAGPLVNNNATIYSRQALDLGDQTCLTLATQLGQRQSPGGMEWSGGSRQNMW